MPMKFALILGGILAAALIALTLVSCSPPPSLTPRQWVLFVDTSGSVTGEQSLHWQGMANKVITRFRPGDSLTIFELNDRTLDNSAIFSRELEQLTGGADDLIRKRREA